LLYNDNYGHQAGDECLKEVAAQLRRAAPRASDVVARYGGEEFVMVLGETDIDGAKWVANHLRQRIVDLKMPHLASPSKYLSVSCGVASVLPQDTLNLGKLLQTADFALYQAKEQGRNKVVGAEYGQGNKVLA
jgi:diguanylate cyclase (GGDEF)-like protein